MESNTFPLDNFNTVHFCDHTVKDFKSLHNYYLIKDITKSVVKLNHKKKCLAVRVVILLLQGHFSLIG